MSSTAIDRVRGVWNRAREIAYDISTPPAGVRPHPLAPVAEAIARVITRRPYGDDVGYDTTPARSPVAKEPASAPIPQRCIGLEINDP